MTSPEQFAVNAIDFDEDIRRAVLQRLPHHSAHAADLRSLSASHLLVSYLNWRSRFIAPKLRKVSISWEFTANALRWDPAYRNSIDHILEALETGRDLTTHLSTRVGSGFGVSGPTELGKRSDLDLLLNDWNVHHLHLSMTMRPDGFVERTGPLLFVIVGSEEAFVIDILDHNAWTREHIAHVMIDNWPNANFVHLNDAIVSAPLVSEQERSMRRNAGIQSGLIEHNGKWYFIGLGGMTSAGTNVMHTIRTNRIQRGLRDFEEQIAGNPKPIIDALALSGLPIPIALDLHFIIRNDVWFAIREENTHALFDIPGVSREPIW